MRHSLAPVHNLRRRIPLAAALVALLATQTLPVTAQSGPPAQPTGLTAGAVSHDSVTIAWDDPGDGSITGYRVLRRSRDGGEYGDGQGAAAFAAIEEDTGSAETTYTDSSVSPRTRYVYRVEALNANGVSERSSYVNVETPETPAEPEEPTEPPTPAQPTGLTAGAVSHDAVTIAWGDPGDDSITGYCAAPGTATPTATARAQRTSRR